MIPYGRQDITDEDIESVIEVLKSDFLTQGPMVPRFEKAVASLVGAKHAVAVNSATSALHIACLSLGLGKGDILWTTPITFVASANCGLYCGAKVDFVDIDPRSYNLSTEALESKLRAAERDRCLPKVLVAVHLCGEPCDMEKIYRLSREYGFRVIEDASHAIGGKYQGAYVGCGKYSDITVFSFHPVKIITTGEGGMAVTNDPALADQMRLLRSHGITRDPRLMTHDPDGPWYYQQVSLGFNYRITDLQCALGVSQILRLEQYVSRRQGLVKRYNDMLASLPLQTPLREPSSSSADHLYIVRIKTDCISANQKEIFQEMRARGVGVNLHYIPVHTHPYYARMGFRPDDFPESMSFYREAMSLPLFQSMSDDEQNHVVAVLREVIET